MKKNTVKLLLVAAIVAVTITFGDYVVSFITTGEIDKIIGVILYALLDVCLIARYYAESRTDA